MVGRTVEATVGELLLKLEVNGSELLAGINLSLDRLSALLVGRLLQDLLAGLLAAEGKSVVVLVPAAEGGGIDLDNGSLHQRLGADELVARGVVDD